MSSEDQKQPVLELKDLEVSFATRNGVVRAIRKVSFQINSRESIGVVGESGCGKSVTAHSITQLLPQPPAFINGGQILLDGEDLLKLNPKQMRKIRAEQLPMIFQEPMSSLNPVFTIGEQLSSAIQLRQGVKIKKAEAKEKALALLELVKIPSAAERIDSYPHQLSGGMLQRVMIALALSASNPRLLIADEPTTALDVTIQAQILDLINDIQAKKGMALLLISHDMGVITRVADRIVVMYAGRVVEQGLTAELINNPQHPYTIGLLNSHPKIREDNTGTDRSQEKILHSIPGSVPSLFELDEECPFINRCMFASTACRKSFPEQTIMNAEKPSDHSYFCYHPQGK